MKHVRLSQRYSKFPKKLLVFIKKLLQNPKCCSKDAHQKTKRLLLKKKILQMYTYFPLISNSPLISKYYFAVQLQQKYGNNIITRISFTENNREETDDVISLLSPKVEASSELSRKSSKKFEKCSETFVWPSNNTRTIFGLEIAKRCSNVAPKMKSCRKVAEYFWDSPRNTIQIVSV